LPNFMQPAEIHWLDAFPKNANGKLDRNILALRLAA
jgi:acyl-coenzyme A synthetase/AMP-(fatty) acid ligase